MDLAVVDVPDLDTYSDNGSREGGLKSKSYAFEGSALALETKVNRKGSKNAVISRLEKDLSKLTRISGRNSSTLYVSF